MNVRLDLFAKESGDPALPPLSDALVESVLGGGQGAVPGGRASREFVEALVRAAGEPKAHGPGQALEPLNPR